MIDIIETESKVEEERDNAKCEMCENYKDKTFHNPSQEDNTLCGQKNLSVQNVILNQ